MATPEQEASLSNLRSAVQDEEVVPQAAVTPPPDSGSEPAPIVSAEAATTAPLTPAPPAPAKSWRDELADDVDLPPSMKGWTRGQVYDKTREFAAGVNQAGQQKNAAERRALELEAELKAIREGRMVPVQAKPETPPAPMSIPGLENDEEIYPQLPKVVRDLYAELKGLREQTATQQKFIQNYENAQTFARVEEIRKSARELVNKDIPVEAWEEYKSLMAMDMMQNAIDPSVAENWAAVARFRKLDKLLVPQAAAAIPQTVMRQAGVPPVGGATPTAAPLTLAPETPTTGNEALDKQAQRMAVSLNRAAKANEHKGVSIKSEAIIERMAERPRAVPQRRTA